MSPSPLWLVLLCPIAMQPPLPCASGEVVRPIVSDERERWLYNSLVGCGTYIFALSDDAHVDATVSLKSAAQPIGRRHCVAFCVGWGVGQLRARA